MLSSTKRRISVLERSMELPITAERFLARVQDRVRFTGESLDEAFRSLLIPLSVENLDRLEEELVQRAGHNRDQRRSFPAAASSVSSRRSGLSPEPLRCQRGARR